MDPPAIPEDLTRGLSPASLSRMLEQEMAGQCVIGDLAWINLRLVCERGRPQVPDGTYTAETPKGADAIRQLLGYQWSMVGTAQAMLVSGEIISRILFEPEPGHPRIRDRPKLSVSNRFPQLRGLTFVELKSRVVRDAFVHLHGKVPRWYNRAQSNPPGFLLTWGVGKGPAPATSYRFLDTDTWTVTAGGESCSLEQLHDEMQLLFRNIPLRFGVRAL